MYAVCGLCTRSTQQCTGCGYFSSDQRCVSAAHQRRMKEAMRSYFPAPGRSGPDLAVQDLLRMLQVQTRAITQPKEAPLLLSRAQLLQAFPQQRLTLGIVADRGHDKTMNRYLQPLAE